jgi:hypothetical protein
MRVDLREPAAAGLMASVDLSRRMARTAGLGRVDRERTWAIAAAWPWRYDIVTIDERVDPAGLACPHSEEEWDGSH